MSTIESIAASLKDLLDAASDLPTDKIAVVGLILLGAGAIVKDLASGNVSDAIDSAKKFVDSQ